VTGKQPWKIKEVKYFNDLKLAKACEDWEHYSSSTAVNM
jgi:hypothetical protein